MDTMKVVVLGGGLVGSTIAMDLSKDKDLEVALVDLKKNRLDNVGNIANIKKILGNVLDDHFLMTILDDCDMVVSSVPGSIGFEVLKKVILAGKSVVDIAFAPESVLELDNLAKSMNVSVFFDCGVAPGMSNMLVARGYSLLDEVDSANIYVGGLPILRQLPYEYKAGFSPSDVIEEYIRPVYCIVDGQIVEKEPLSDLELINFDNVGTLEAFNTDGLRSLIKTLDIPNMEEKTLRYPGHVDKIKLLKETGFFRTDELDINGIKIKPIDLTSRLLFPIWNLKDGDLDITIMKIMVKGKKSNNNTKYECYLYDTYDSGTKVHSMARTTGYTATTVLRMIKKGYFSDLVGVIPPEKIGLNSQYMDCLLNMLKEKGVVYNEISY